MSFSPGVSRLSARQRQTCVLAWVGFLCDEVKGKCELLWDFSLEIEVPCNHHHSARTGPPTRPPLRGHLAAAVLAHIDCPCHPSTPASCTDGVAGGYQSSKPIFVSALDSLEVYAVVLTHPDKFYPGSMPTSVTSSPVSSR